MEFMVEIVVTAFAMGGVLGAVVALQLSANLKQPDTHSTTRSTLGANSNTEANSTPPVLQPAPIKVHSVPTRRTNPRRR